MQFRHPTISDGALSQGEESWPIHKGLVDCPEAIGRDHGWVRASAEELDAQAARLEVLKGSVPDVVGALSEVHAQRELEALEVAEKAGRNRAGVLKALEARWAELEPKA